MSPLHDEPPALERESIVAMTESPATTDLEGMSREKRRSFSTATTTTPKLHHKASPYLTDDDDTQEVLFRDEDEEMDESDRFHYRLRCFFFVFGILSVAAVLLSVFLIPSGEVAKLLRGTNSTTTVNNNNNNDGP